MEEEGRGKRNKKKQQTKKQPKKKKNTFRKRGKCESARCSSSLYSCHVTTSSSKCKSIAMPDYVTELRGKVPSPVSFSPLKNFHPGRDEEARPFKRLSPPPFPAGVPFFSES